MYRPLFLVTLLIAAAFVPAATAHTPPAPVLTCQNVAAGGGKYHEYLPPNTGFLVVGGDGNLENCPEPNAVNVGPVVPVDELCVVVVVICGADICVVVVVICDGGCTIIIVITCDGWCVIIVVCTSAQVTDDQPVFDYDGELDHANGGAYLFVTTGDGLTSGVAACFGEPSTGHHDNTVYAQDTLGFGPQFSVTSDYSRAGLEETPDCGDNYVEPCDPNPPVPSTLDFPLNVVVDTVNGVLYGLFGPGGEGCNVLDSAYRCASTAIGPSRCTVPFTAGADGALVVFLEPDTNNGRVPTTGHVWTN